MKPPEFQHPLDIRDILPPDYDGETVIDCPPWAFKPDEWTRALLRGVAKLDLHDADVAEAGVGPGTNQIYVTKAKRPARSYGSDLDGRLPRVAAGNVLRAAGQQAAERFTPIHGNQSLLSWITRQRLDVVLACIPQVPADHHDERTLAQVRAFAAKVNGNGTDVQTDELSHYYDPDTYPSDLNAFGLGLNDHLLQQARGVLRARGKAILNLGGRPGRPTLEGMFRKNGFTPTLLHSELIQQHPGTDLEPLATLEKHTDHAFEFFADDRGERQITAREAEDLRRAGHPVYHNIYVFSGEAE